MGTFCKVEPAWWPSVRPRYPPPQHWGPQNSICFASSNAHKFCSLLWRSCFKNSRWKPENRRSFSGSLFHCSTTGHSKFFAKDDPTSSWYENFHGSKENSAFERDSARLLSLSVRHAGAWLSAPPISALGLHMAPNEFRISVEYSFGDPVYDAGRKSPFCKAGVLDIYGDHAIACHGRGKAIARLDRIRGKIISAFSSANLSTVVEKKNFIPESQSRPGDVFVPTWKAGKPAAFDITVTSSPQSYSLFNAATKAG